MPHLSLLFYCPRVLEEGDETRASKGFIWRLCGTMRSGMLSAQLFAVGPQSDQWGPFEASFNGSLYCNWMLLGSILNLDRNCYGRPASRRMSCTSKIAAALKVDRFARTFAIHTLCSWGVSEAFESKSQVHRLSNRAPCFFDVSAALEVETVVRSYFRNGSYFPHVSAPPEVEAVIFSVSSRESRLDV